MHESLFRRIGLLAMVASGVAMFSLSGQQILSIHRAWIAYVAPGDEPELQLYWGGTRRAAIEREGNRALSVEHSISLADLPAPVRVALPTLIGTGRIVLIERVHGNPAHYEIYWRRDGKLYQIELTADGRPA